MPACAVVLVQLLHVDAALWSLRGHTVFPVKSSIVPQGPVNWLITSLMHMEQAVTKATLSDGQVTSEPKTRASLILGKNASEKT